MFICRYVLVKYSDRGLVGSDGINSSLFEQLYLTIAVALNMFQYCMILVSHTRDNFKPVIVGVCLGHDSEDHVWRGIIVEIGVLGVSMIVTIIMYLSTIKFASSRRGIIFGKYQRNIATFQQTIIYNTTLIVVGLIDVVLVVNLNSVAWHITTIVMMAVFPFTLIFNLKKSEVQVMPSTEFYVHNPIIAPRRDILNLTESVPELDIVQIPKIIVVAPVDSSR